MDIHPHLILRNQPELREPIFIAAWAGWNDAGESASHATRYLAATLGAEKFAEIDPEEYYDFTNARPVARYRDGHREIMWPTTDFYAVVRDDQSHDLILGVGVEPNYHWKNYIEAISALTQLMQVKLVVTVGAVAAAVPHTRTVQVIGSATTSQLSEKYDMQHSTYEGPTGIVGIFHDYCRRTDIDAISLWASVSHYLPGIVNPLGSLALLESLTSICNLTIDYSRLEQERDRFAKQVAVAIEEDDNLTEYVRRLEEIQSDEHLLPPSADLPSSHGLIDELEDFLRQSRGGS